MDETNSSLFRKKYQQVHCLSCGGTEVSLSSGKGKFKGSVGGMVARHKCKTCGSEFTVIITGDEFFPDRGFPFTPKDLDVLFGKTA